MLSALVVNMTQKQPNMSSSALTCMHHEYCSQLLIFEQWLTLVDTMPDIQFCLLQGLHMEQSSLFTPFASPSKQLVAQAQDHIGWSNLLLGQLTNRLVWSTTLPFVQHLFLLHIYFLSYWSCHPTFDNFPQPLHLPKLCGP